MAPMAWLRSQLAWLRTSSLLPSNSTSLLLLPSHPLPSVAWLRSLLSGEEMAPMDAFAPIDWQEESYPAYSDFLVLPFFALFFPTIRFFLDRFVFEKLGRRLIFGKGHKKLEDETVEVKRKVKKFKESAWKCIYFLSAELLSLYVTYDEPWFTNTKYFWVGPKDQVWPDQKMKFKLKAVYMYAAGFYTYSIGALLFWETRRADFGVSMTHHLASVVLIVLSYVLRFSRVGSVVLAVHDATDVFLEIGKMSKYTSCERLAAISFLTFVVSWFILRLVYYPFWILRSTSYEGVLYMKNERPEYKGPIYYYIFNTLLFTLLVLHIYWWVLMYRMLVEQFRSGGGRVGQDVRSDSEGEEDEHED